MLAVSVTIPSLVRVKPGALLRLGVYARRENLDRVALLHSQGLDPRILSPALESLRAAQVRVEPILPVASSTLEAAETAAARLSPGINAVIGLGGGKALDVAKYAAYRSGLPYIAVPTSLSNDGFASHQVSLESEGKRQSLPAAIPAGVVVDTEVCLQAPLILWQAGIGDLVAKITAVRDWKLAWHSAGTPVNDLAALLALSTVYQFMARPIRDLEGVRLLATSLLLNGLAMEIAGSSRPASGSEHLISHALDLVSARPRLHGLQVGIAAYIVAHWQGEDPAAIGRLFEATGFWDAVKADPFVAQEWVAALRRAPALKKDFYSVLTGRDVAADFQTLIQDDADLRACFRPAAG